MLQPHPPHDEHPNLRVLDHPLIQHMLTRARAKRTGSEEFRRLLHNIAALMTFEATRDLPVEPVDIETPMEPAAGLRLARPITVVPIFRAGLGMTDGILRLIPAARVGHVGVYRDETSLQPVSYYLKMPPDVATGPVLVVDPMVATGGSVVHAVGELKSLGCETVRVVCLVCAPPGVRRLQERHPDVPIYAAALDRDLDERGFIRPGLGDAGDRLFGTAG